MKNPNSHPTNFWFGFAVGSITAAATGYFLGTKQGRQTLKKIIEYAETVEEHEGPVLLEHIKNAMKTISQNTSEIGEEAPVLERPPQSIENIMEKIKTVVQPKKYVQKFFAKSGEILHK